MPHSPARAPFTAEPEHRLRIAVMPGCRLQPSARLPHSTVHANVGRPQSATALPAPISLAWRQRRLGQAAPFAWSTYRFGKEDALYVYRQTVGASAGGDAGPVNWNGREIVAFRLHLPSKVAYQNTQDKRRGNIFVWEQPLAERLKGTPVEIEARMETQSILYRTLWLFGATFLAVAAAFALVIGWLLRRRS